MYDLTSPPIERLHSSPSFSFIFFSSNTLFLPLVDCFFFSLFVIFSRHSLPSIYFFPSIFVILLHYLSSQEFVNPVTFSRHFPWIDFVTLHHFLSSLHDTTSQCPKRLHFFHEYLKSIHPFILIHINPLEKKTHTLSRTT